MRRREKGERGSQSWGATGKIRTKSPNLRTDQTATLFSPVNLQRNKQFSSHFSTFDFSILISCFLKRYNLVTVLLNLTDLNVFQKISLINTHPVKIRMVHPLHYEYNKFKFGLYV